MTTPLADDTGGSHFESEVVAAPGQTYRQIVIVPDGATIATASVTIDPIDRDVGQLADLFYPSLTLTKVDRTGDYAASTFLAGATDSGNDGAYSAPHDLELCAHEKVDLSRFLYFVTYTHEQGAWASDVLVHAVVVSYSQR